MSIKIQGNDRLQRKEPFSQKQVREYVRQQDEGDIQKIYGPSFLMKGYIWEVWVYVENEGEYYTRYVFDQIEEGVSYFTEFQEFMIFINIRIPKATVTLYASSFVFVASTLTLLILLFMGKADINEASVQAMLGGLIASGGTAFFGSWVKAQ